MLEPMRAVPREATFWSNSKAGSLEGYRQGDFINRAVYFRSQMTFDNAAKMIGCTGGEAREHERRVLRKVALELGIDLAECRGVWRSSERKALRKGRSPSEVFHRA